jgi:hypothetical protein
MQLKNPMGSKQERLSAKQFFKDRHRPNPEQLFFDQTTIKT